MDDEVELAPELLDLGEDRVDRGAVGDVAMADDMAAEFLGERLDPLLQRVALIGEGEFRTRVRRSLGDAQAMDRLFATPITRPRLPLRRLAVGETALESGMGNPQMNDEQVS